MAGKHLHVELSEEPGEEPSEEPSEEPTATGLTLKMKPGVVLGVSRMSSNQFYTIRSC